MSYHFFLRIQVRLQSPTILSSFQRVVAKETKLHLAQKELNKLEEQLINADTTKAQTTVELEMAKRIVEDLTQKLKTHNELKDIAIMATESAKYKQSNLKKQEVANLKEMMYLHVGTGWKRNTRIEI